MKNFNIKSLVLGVGIGIVLTSIISLIYTAGIVNVKMSNQQIIDQAKKLGMIEDTQIIKNSSNLSENQIETSKETSSVKPRVDNSAPKETNELNSAASAEKPNTGDQVIKVSITPGEPSEAVADSLLKKGLISDKDAFLKELKDMGLTSKINVGEFEFKKGSEMKAMIKILTEVD
jgi:hypothetical protein